MWPLSRNDQRVQDGVEPAVDPGDNLQPVGVGRVG
jgi:hypothetical protein